MRAAALKRPPTGPDGGRAGPGGAGPAGGCAVPHPGRGADAGCCHSPGSGMGVRGGTAAEAGVWGETVPGVRSRVRLAGMTMPQGCFAGAAVRCPYRYQLGRGQAAGRRRPAAHRAEWPEAAPDWRGAASRTARPPSAGRPRTPAGSPRRSRLRGGPRPAARNGSGRWPRRPADPPNGLYTAARFTQLLARRRPQDHRQRRLERSRRPVLHGPAGSRRPGLHGRDPARRSPATSRAIPRTTSGTGRDRGSAGLQRSTSRPARRRRRRPRHR